jgi:hypothetical protein
MNIHAEKIKLIEWITQINDVVVLDKLLQFRSKNHADWWDELNDYEKDELNLGLKDLDEGNTIDHSEARKLYEKYL